MTNTKYKINQLQLQQTITAYKSNRKMTQIIAKTNTNKIYIIRVIVIVATPVAVLTVLAVIATPVATLTVRAVA
jgi:hypothetical protein